MNLRAIIKTTLLFWGYMFHRNRDSKVIFYHDVGLDYTDMGTPFEIIKKHVKQIKECGFSIVKQINEKKNQVMICFDDGWSGLYDNKDYFLSEKIFPTVFIAVDLIGTPGHMTKEQIIELAREGFVFQAHSWSHDDLTQYDDKGLHKELFEAKEYMEKMLSLQFDAVCFPIGFYNNKVIQEAVNSGYKYLYSSIWGGYYDLLNEGIICRNLAQDIPPHTIKYVVRGSSPYLTSRYYRQHFKN